MTRDVEDLAANLTYQLGVAEPGATSSTVACSVVDHQGGSPETPGSSCRATQGRRQGR
jgi:hypothetical protein